MPFLWVECAPSRSSVVLQCCKETNSPQLVDVGLWTDLPGDRNTGAEVREKCKNTKVIHLEWNLLCDRCEWEEYFIFYCVRVCMSVCVCVSVRVCGGGKLFSTCHSAFHRSRRKSKWFEGCALVPICRAVLSEWLHVYNIKDRMTTRLSCMQTTRCTKTHNNKNSL